MTSKQEKLVYFIGSDRSVYCRPDGSIESKIIDKLTQIRLPKNIKDIYVAKETHIIFANLEKQIFYVAGNTGTNEPFDEYADDNTKYEKMEHTLINVEFFELYPMNYFSKNKIKIKQIFCTKSKTFWISEKNKIYGNGYNYNGSLGVGDYRYHGEPKLIKGLSNVNVQYMDETEHNSYVLCSKYYESEEKMVIHGFIRNYTNLEIPLSVIELIKIFVDLQDIAVYKTKDEKWERWKIFDRKQIIQIACGYDHGLFLQKNGIIWSFGRNKDGQLGTGLCDEWNEKKDHEPQKIKYFAENNIQIVDIKCGSCHSLALDVNGIVYSWGCNGQCQCGFNTQMSQILLPKPLTMFDKKIKSICAGYLHSCVVSNDDKYYFFGSNAANECMKSRNRFGINVTEPWCVNDMVKEQCEGASITGVYLGHECTLIEIFID